MHVVPPADGNVDVSLPKPPTTAVSAEGTCAKVDSLRSTPVSEMSSTSAEPIALAATCGFGNLPVRSPPAGPLGEPPPAPPVPAGPAGPCGPRSPCGPLAPITPSDSGSFPSLPTTGIVPGAPESAERRPFSLEVLPAFFANPAVLANGTTAVNRSPAAWPSGVAPRTATTSAAIDRTRGARWRMNPPWIRSGARVGSHPPYEAARRDERRGNPPLWGDYAGPSNRASRARERTPSFA